MIIKIRIGDKENLRVEIIEDFHVIFYFYYYIKIVCRLKNIKIDKDSNIELKKLVF